MHAFLLSPFSCVRLCVTLWTATHQAPLSTGFSMTLAIPWTVARQAPLSMGFSRQEYWSGLPFPSPGDLPHPGIEPASSDCQADSLPLSHLRNTPMQTVSFMNVGGTHFFHSPEPSTMLGAKQPLSRCLLEESENTWL